MDKITKCLWAMAVSFVLLCIANLVAIFIDAAIGGVMGVVTGLAVAVSMMATVLACAK